MSEAHFDVLGIGNAIVDIIARCEDDVLTKYGLSKGHMRLIDEAEADRLYSAMGPAVEISGGSAANTIAGIASFGGQCSFIGKVANDQFGRVFRHDIRSIGVTYQTEPALNTTPTARCLVFVTPDGERTMNTYLGASVGLSDDEIDPDVVRRAQLTYLEGYLFDPPEAKAAFHKAAQIAGKNGQMIALSLSDLFCVERHRDDFLQFISESVDILFANEEEILSLYQVATIEEACDKVREHTTIAALTQSAKGSVIVTKQERIAVPAFPVEKVVDTTGAGDLYAAGFLYGYINDFPLETCGRLAGLAAAEVISHIGARPETPLDSLARKEGLMN